MITITNEGKLDGAVDIGDMDIGTVFIDEDGDICIRIDDMEDNRNIVAIRSDGEVIVTGKDDSARYVPIDIEITIK